VSVREHTSYSRGFASTTISAAPPPDFAALFLACLESALLAGALLPLAFFFILSAAWPLPIVANASLLDLPDIFFFGARIVFCY
jgi:hypothetical protein